MATWAEPKETLGARLCSDLDLEFDETFQRQFVFADTLPALPDHWTRSVLGTWTLAHCPRLGATEINRTDGSNAGVILGVALTADGTALKGRVSADLKDWQEAESFAESLAGRFVAFLSVGGEVRVYVDPSCSLVPFYDAETRVVGSCLPLVLTRQVEDNPWLPKAQYDSAPNQFYLFGQTADARARRMLGNHYLDLSDFTQHRHYPKPDYELDEDRPRSDVLDDLIGLLEAQMKGLITNYRCSLPLTGGGDSRILFACSKDWHHQVAEFYTHVNHYNSVLDSMVAQSMAEAGNVPLRITNVLVPKMHEELSPERCGQLREMIALRSSFQMRPDDKTIRAHEQAPEAELTLRGGLVEMTRSNKWPKGAVEITPRSGTIALARPLQMPQGFIEAATPLYGEWLDGLPEGSRPRAFDFGHVELWMPTMGNTVYNGFQRPFMMNPFNSRRILHLTASLPPHFRKVGRPQRYIVRSCFPDLARLPYSGNRMGTDLMGAENIRDLFARLGRKL